MKEVVGEFIGKAIGTTFFGGSKPINGVWATFDITVCNAAIMPAGYGIGDHRLFVINFASKDIIGTNSPKIICPASRRLNTKLARVAAEYSRLLEEKIIRHRLIKCVGKAHVSSRSRQSFTRCLNHLDKELGNYMRCAKKHCWKIKQGGSYSLQRHHYGYAELKFIDCCLDTMRARYSIKATSTKQQGDATSRMPSPYPYRRYTSA